METVSKGIATAGIDEPLAIVVVSDIHAGPEHPFAELRIGDGPLEGRAFTREALSTSIAELLKGITPARRILVCAGDISTKCNSEELRKACTFLTELSRDLEVPEGQRFIVPGNHDIDWRLTQLAEEDPWYDALRQRKFEELVGAHAEGFRWCSKSTPIHVELPGLNASIFLLDSPGEDRHDQTPHRGQLGESQLRALEKMLAESAQPLKVVVLHHHVLPMRREVDPPDYSVLNDAFELTKLLEQHDVQLVIHGHQHRPWIHTQASQMIVVGAGTTTAWHRLPPETRGAFHIVVAETLTERRLSGRVHTRVLKSTQGWRAPSYTSDGLVGNKPFGADLGHGVLDQLAATAIEQCKVEKLLYLRQFLSQQDRGNYVCEHEFGDLVQKHLARNKDTGVVVVHDPERDVCQLQLAGVER